MRSTPFVISVPEDSTVDESLTLGEDEDLAMTQTEVNYKCPYTGREMVKPMKNKTCGHNYDEEAVREMFKAKSTVK